MARARAGASARAARTLTCRAAEHRSRPGRVRVPRPAEQRLHLHRAPRLRSTRPPPSRMVRVPVMSIIGVGIARPRSSGSARRWNAAPGYGKAALPGERVAAARRVNAGRRLARRLLRGEGGAGQGAGRTGGTAADGRRGTSRTAGSPRLRVTGTVAARAAELGVASWQRAPWGHDAGIASAVVIAGARTRREPTRGKGGPRGHPGVRSPYAPRWPAGTVT